jgi:hypothetical protein
MCITIASEQGTYHFELSGWRQDVSETSDTNSTMIWPIAIEDIIKHKYLYCTVHSIANFDLFWSS